MTAKHFCQVTPTSPPLPNACKSLHSNNLLKQLTAVSVSYAKREAAAGFSASCCTAAATGSGFTGSGAAGACSNRPSSTLASSFFTPRPPPSLPAGLRACTSREPAAYTQKKRRVTRYVQAATPQQTQAGVKMLRTAQLKVSLKRRLNPRTSPVPWAAAGATRCDRLAVPSSNWSDETSKGCMRHGRQCDDQQSICCNKHFTDPLLKFQALQQCT
jgi:hypothetical protein